ncbi:MAG TPA: methyltransferase domain-containing protein [Candidatus Saccharimonadales bacterium]|nr:methyltransferase domain-containing protein [Candidatus Saccharimonadales bacterium]
MATKKQEAVEYFENTRGIPIKVPSLGKTLISRIALPLLSLVSRDKALDWHLTPIDDERVIMALKYTRGRALDIGCGANNFIKSYGNGLGVDVFPWQGCDQVIKNAANLPFKKGEFQTITYLACLNHIPNRDDSVKAAFKLLDKGGRVLITMITPRWGKFIHWIRFRNDPDHKDRHIDHDHELLGMSSRQVKSILKEAGFSNIKRKRFVFGLNNIYIAQKD